MRCLGLIQTLLPLILPVLLTETCCHLVQGDPDGAVRGGVIWVKSQELLAQQTQTLLLPAGLFVCVFLFLHSFKLNQQIIERRIIIMIMVVFYNES